MARSPRAAEMRDSHHKWNSARGWEAALVVGKICFAWPPLRLDIAETRRGLPRWKYRPPSLGEPTELSGLTQGVADSARGKTSFGTSVSALDVVALLEPSANRTGNQLVALASQSKFCKEALHHRVSRNPRMMGTQSGNRFCLCVAREKLHKHLDTVGDGLSLRSGARRRAAVPAELTFKK